MHILYRAIGMIVLSLMSYVYVEGQNKNDSAIKFQPFVSLNMGLSVPLSPFVPFNNGMPNERAQAGYLINVNISYPINKSAFSADLLFNYGQNGYDESSAGDGRDVKILKTGNFSQFSILSGSAYSIMVKKTTLDFRLLGGVLFFDNPEITYAQLYNYGLNQAIYDTKQNNINAFAIDAAIGIHFPVTNRLIFSWNVSTFYATKKEAITCYVGKDTFTSSLKVNLINFSVGMRYKIE